MSGPPPTPTALKILRGNPGHRKLNRTEPQPGPLLSLDPPPELPAPAAAIWRAIAPEAARLTLLDTLSVRVFATACRLQAVGEAQLARVERKPGAKPTTALWAAAKCLEKAATLWARFGLDPASRSRLHTLGPDDHRDELTTFRQAHPRAR